MYLINVIMNTLYHLNKTITHCNVQKQPYIYRNVNLDNKICYNEYATFEKQYSLLNFVS